MPVVAILQAYARHIRGQRRANADAAETALAPAFQRMLQDLCAELPAAAGLTVAPEYLNPGVGRPDIALLRPGAPARAFVELKAPSKSSDPTRWRAHDRRQYERLRELACWAASNFSELRLFDRGDEVADATIVPARCLDPTREDARADRDIARHDFGPLLRLVERLAVAAGLEPVARDAEHLATLMAHAARLVRGIVQDRLAELQADEQPHHALLQVRQEFRDVLYAHPEAAGYPAADFNALFSAAFAQTLAFGLLLVREGTGRAVGADAWEHMPAEHPLMRTTLRILSLPEIVEEMGIGFHVMRDTVNSFAAEILASAPGDPDPILYFYENFLQTFDPEARERYGVYYTPVAVVRYMVAALDGALRDRLRTEGLRDPAVTILDPATGTGTFLLGIAERVRMQQAAGGEGMVTLALRNLALRMFAFELLVGPYAVAHYRLHHALSGSQPEGDQQPAAPALPRLGVYLADTLAEPGAAAPMGRLGFLAQGIADERTEANRIKAEQPILAIIGNPPYRRLEEGENRTLVGDWMDGVWDDLKAPVREAGYGNQLNTFPELSIAFWRWAIWKLFEAENAPRRGVVAFISNRKYLTGWPYAGLRRMMRERFDRIEIVDLRGDIRRGERAGVAADQGVFAVKVGTAITLAIADGSRADGEAAEVRYYDSWSDGLYARRAKLDWLTAAADGARRPDFIAVDRGALDDFRPEPFQGAEWLPLTNVFLFCKSGMKSGGDDTFVSVKRRALCAKVEAFLGPDSPYQYNPALERQLSYRPLDVRWFYNDLPMLDRPGPAMQRVWGDVNVGLYAMPGGTGAGPAAWCHGLLPDYHALRGSYGGYAFPLHDRRPDANAPNVTPDLVAALGTAYGVAVSAEEVFDAILCLLSAAGYSHRFAEDLEDVFPHVLFPARHEVFRRAAALGGEIRAVETFARAPAERYRPPGFARVTTLPRGAVGPVEFADGAIDLCADGSGRITGIPEAVWTFSVSGYRVLPRWLEGRIGLPADLDLVNELRDVCARIAELIDLFAAANEPLEAALREPLTRDALGREA